MIIPDNFWDKEVVVDFGNGHSRLGILCKDKCTDQYIVLRSSILAEFIIRRSAVYGIGLCRAQPPDYKIEGE